jgi:hypothetical protein
MAEHGKQTHPREAWDSLKVRRENLHDVDDRVLDFAQDFEHLYLPRDRLVDRYIRSEHWLYLHFRIPTMIGVSDHTEGRQYAICAQGAKIPYDVGNDDSISSDSEPPLGQRADREIGPPVFVNILEGSQDPKDVPIGREVRPARIGLYLLDHLLVRVGEVHDLAESASTAGPLPALIQSGEKPFLRADGELDNVLVWRRVFPRIQDGELVDEMVERCALVVKDLADDWPPFWRRGLDPLDADHAVAVRFDLGATAIRAGFDELIAGRAQILNMRLCSVEPKKALVELPRPFAVEEQVAHAATLSA